VQVFVPFSTAPSWKTEAPFVTVQSCSSGCARQPVEPSPKVFALVGIEHAGALDADEVEEVGPDALEHAAPIAARIM